MTEIMEALQAFFSQFGVPAFAEDSIPKDAELPYITFTPVLTPWDEITQTSARVWTHSNSYATVSSIVNKIEKAVGEAKMLPAGTGGVYICKGNPWVQPQSIANSEVKVAYLNFGISTIY